MTRQTVTAPDWVRALSPAVTRVDVLGTRDGIVTRRLRTSFHLAR